MSADKPGGSEAEAAAGAGAEVKEEQEAGDPALTRERPIHKGELRTIRFTRTTKLPHQHISKTHAQMLQNPVVPCTPPALIILRHVCRSVRTCGMAVQTPHGSTADLHEDGVCLAACPSTLHQQPTLGHAGLQDHRLMRLQWTSPA